MLSTHLSSLQILLLAIVLGGGIALADDAVPSAQAQQPAPSKEFIPVDTSSVMGSPNPALLEAERVFPKLQFKRPIELTYPDDGTNRLFIVEQQGMIHVLENKPDAESTSTFLDLRDVVSREGNEEGLLGLAFHPRYRDNGQFYVYYSTKPRASIVARFRVSGGDPNRADRQSEEILLRIEQPYGNHNGGSIKFGPDGYLYIGLGDGGLANDPHGHGQNLQTLLGSILRIDIDRREDGKPYAVPDDNPFAERPFAERTDGARGEIWAYGLRNVWRLAFDRKTGHLWAGDVGQDRFEEVDRIVRGGNYGWNRREGFHPFDPDARLTGDDAIVPIAEYFHGDGRSVTGGIVYRGDRLPGFEGAYFYADYVTGMVWIVPPGEQAFDGQPQSVETSTAGMDTTSPRYGKIVACTGLEIAAFGEDQQGRMYLLAFDGKVYRLRPRDIDAQAIRDAFPQKLSQTRFFQDVESLQPAAGLIPYRVSLPLWSDGAVKQRFLALPEARSVTFDPRKKWAFPVGTVFVKTFFKPTGNVVPPAEATQIDKLERLETRLFVHSPRGWRGYTYVWNEAQTEAELLRGALEKKYEIQTAEGRQQRTWYFPSSVDCMACHTKAAGFVLGPTARQFNLVFDYGHDRANQLEVLDRLDVFTEELPAQPETLPAYADWRAMSIDGAVEQDRQSVGELARAYLDVNCAVCHRKEGYAQKIDLRFYTPLEKTSLINAKVLQGHLGPADSKRLVPGRPSHSALLHRMIRRGHRQMPPLATNVVDRKAVAVLRRWIEALDAP